MSSGSINVSPNSIYVQTDLIYMSPGSICM
jgi:hypothetical protein